MPVWSAAPYNQPLSIALDGTDMAVPFTLTINAVAYVWAGSTVTTTITGLTDVAAAVPTLTFTTGAAGAGTISLTSVQKTTLGVGTFKYSFVISVGAVLVFEMAGQLSITLGTSPGTTTLGVTAVITSGTVAVTLTAVPAVASTIAVTDSTNRWTTDTLQGVADESETLAVIRKRARALLANYDAQPAYTNTAYAGTATPVLSAGGAATTIAGGIKVPFARLSSSFIDTANDPNFTYQGVVPGKQVVINTDMSVGDILTGGSSQAAGWETRTGFWYTGQKFGIYFNALATSVPCQVWINGAPIATPAAVLTVTIGQRYHYEIDFGSAELRLIEYKISRTTAQINGVTIEPTASIRRAPLRPKFAVLGDSVPVTAGAGGGSFSDVWADRVAALFGMDNWRISIGGTGYSTLTGTSAFIDRVVDCVSVAPDILIISGGQNDTAQSQGTITTLATTLIQALQAALPNTIIMVLGCHQVNELVNGTRKATDEGIKAAATACSVPFRSLIDPCGLYDTTTTHLISTAYAVGDRVRDTTNSRNVWVCHTAHTSGGANPDVTKFYAQSFITGQGKVGSTTGRGNADLFVQADGVHLTVAGHKAYAGFVSEWVAATLRTIALV